MILEAMPWRHVENMNKKQKKVLVRIIVTIILLVLLHFLPVEGYVRMALYLIPYLVIGYDILKKAFKGISKKTVIKVPKKKLAAYRKLLKKKGLSSKNRIKGY